MADREENNLPPQDLRKAVWLLVGRQAILVLGIIILLTHEGGSVWSAPLFRSAYVFLIAASCVNLIIMSVVRRFGGTGWFAASQIGLDAFLISALVYLTGGVGSNFTPLYFAAIISTSILLSSGASILLASICTVLLSSVSLIYFFSFLYEFPLPFVAPEWGILSEHELTFILAFLVAHAGAFHAVALLSGWLASGEKQMRIMTDEILQNMAGGVIATNRDGVVVYINAAACSMLGLKTVQREPMIPASDLFSSKNHAPVLESLLSFSDGSRDITVSRDEPPGEIPIEIRTSLMKDDKERCRGLIAILDDLSLRHEIEETRRSVERMEAISEVSAGIPHEVRNPLASIRGAIQEVEETVEMGDESRQLLEVALSETDRLDRIVTDFLQFARRKRLKLGRVNVGKLIEEVGFLLKSRRRSSDVTLDLDVRPELYCSCDRDQIQQVLLNVGLNALEAVGEKGSLRIEAESETRIVPGMCIRFADSGGGVEEDTRDKLFEPFWSTKTGGTGLGLSLARRIALDHGGSIDVVNNDLGGATFSIWLPSTQRS